MSRDHTCEYPNCIHLALETCKKKCGRWLCGEHLKKHSCKTLDAWAVSSPTLNAMASLGALDVKPPDGKDWRLALR